MADQYEESAKAPDTSEDEKILADFQQTFKEIADDETDIRREWKEDKEFTWTDDQWATEEKVPGTEYVTVNKLQAFARQVTNDALQNKLAIRVRPVDDAADIRTAKVIQGLCRATERDSNAQVAYQTAFEDAVAAGRGFFRILTRYRSEDSFEQEAYFAQVENALSVFFDKNSREKDGSDAEKGGFYYRVSKEKFQRDWPDVPAIDVDNIGSDPGDTVWGDRNTVLIAEFFRKEYVPEMLYLVMPQGAEKPVAIWESEAKKKSIDISEPLNKRKSYRCRVMGYKVGAKKILERKEFPSKYIPIIPVIGRYTNIDGKRSFKGLTRYGRASQKLYNYSRTKQRERLAMSNTAQWIGPEGTFEGHQTKWRLANVRRFPYLEYKPTSLNGQFAPAPQRINPPTVDSTLTEETAITSEELKSTTGIYDPGLGKSENDQSGRAVLALQRQGQTSTYDFVSNLILSIAHGGRILVDMFPRIYDTAQAVRILGDNEKEEIVRINDPSFVDPKTGKPVLYDFSAGKYDVSVDAGPSYATKRQEAAESIMAYIGTPGGAPFGEISGDILASAQDWEGADELAERYRKFLANKYPGLVDQKDENGNPVQGPPPEVVQIEQQADQAIQEMQAEIAALKEQAEGKHLDAQTKLDIAEMDNATKIHIAKIQAGQNEDLRVIAQEILYLRSVIEQHGLSANAPEPEPPAGEPGPAEEAAPIME